VQKFTSGGVFIQQWGSKGADLGPLHFWYPYGIACDTVHGYIYVGDTGNSRIVRFDLDGNPVGSPITAHSAPAITSIHGMACDPSGNLYVCERSTDGVVKYDSSGAFQGVINGSGDHVLDKPYGVACDGSGNVFVADTLNNRVVQFSSGGAFVRRWGSYGTGNGGLSYPRGIACDSSGNVYVANFHFPFVCQKFSRSGVWKARWGDSAAEGDLGFPSAVACGAGGAVYVTEIEQDKTFKYVAVNGPTTLALANVSVAQGSKAKFRFRVNDASSASAVVTIKLYKGKVLKKALKVGSKPTNAAQTYRWTCSLSPGSYVWRVYARDAAGYKQVKIGSKKLTVL
jgi:DNA-binding beta-propeller fold protein YncE